MRKRKGLATENSGGTVVKGRVENLRPWPKGTSGNPGGRPKSAALSEAFREVLAEVVVTSAGEFTVAELIARRLARDAVRRGSVGAARELGNRAEGFPCSTLDVAGEHRVTVVFDIPAPAREVSPEAAAHETAVRREAARRLIRSGGGQDGKKPVD